MNKGVLALGVVLIIIAIILGAIQVGAHVFSIYGSSTTKYGYYGLVGIIGLIGIILAAWAYMMKPKMQKPEQKQEIKPEQAQTPKQ
ncbi:MAG: hypothetical protein ABSB89_08705 [Candidatus Bathyarchaeia archaeon]